MPKIYEYFGFVFFFYSNEHEPIHVHVKKGGNEIVFEIIMDNGNLSKIIRRECSGGSLSEKDIAIAYKFIEKYWKNIVSKWVNFFVMKKKVRSTTITQKI